MSKKSKKLKLKLLVPIALALSVVALAAWYLSGVDIPVMQPNGLVGEKERDLMVFTVLLGLLIIVPVFAMTIIIAWRYREGNTKARAKYTPEWDRHKLAEFAWWGFPIAIITVLSVVTWTSTHQLDPWKPLAHSSKPLEIQVVSLDWKWLFIYPEQQIATVNFAQFPADRQVDFEITSDSVMSSFWIPSLGSQIYSMPGMSTHVHLVADKNGDYNGASANINGEGFAGMKFVARASSEADFDRWVQSIASRPAELTAAKYAELAKPSKDHPRASYALADKNLYATIVMKYMDHGHKQPEAEATYGQSESDPNIMSDEQSTPMMHHDHSSHTHMEMN